MSKRGPEPNGSHYQPHKYRKQSAGSARQYSGSRDSRSGGGGQHQSLPRIDVNAVAKLPPSTGSAGAIPNFVNFTAPTGAPPLPLIPEGNPLEAAPFRHKSTINYSRSTSNKSDSSDLTYEKLEYYGDAYLEVLATRLIFHRYPHLPAGQMSQLRELLVKNETLAGYARMYGFEERLEVSDKESMLAGVKGKDSEKERGNKGMNKVLGDVFEAYLAAVVLADAEEGFSVAEKWMTALWASKLVEAGYGAEHIAGDASGDLTKSYDPEAKATLQKRIMGPDVRLEYRVDKPSVELKGDQIGQNLHFIALYLHGWGYEGELLGKGEGKNKAEAGAWAAIQAMHGDQKGLVDECAEKFKVVQEESRKKREAKQAARDAQKADGGGAGKTEAGEVKD